MFLGMDVEQAQDHAERLAGAAERLAGLREHLAHRLGEVTWTGPDADLFRRDALLALDGLTGTSALVRARGVLLHTQASQQESASARDGAGAREAGGLTASAFHRGLATGPYDDPRDDIAPIGPADVTRPDADDLVAPHDLADLLTNLDAVASAQTDDATAIRVQQIIGEDGQARYVVYVPGSHGLMANTLGPVDIGGNPMDWNQNPGALLGGETDSSQAVLAAMEAAGIPHGADVVLVGHSQGGIVSSNLAADPTVNGAADGWNITDVVSVGSPVELAAVPPTTNTINFAHEPVGPSMTSLVGPWSSMRIGLPDVVPGLDLNPHDLFGTPDHRHEIELPTISYDLGANHSIPQYRESVEHLLEVDPDGTAARFQDSPSMQHLLGPGALVSDTADIAVSRAEGTHLPSGIPEDLWDPQDVIM